MLQFRRRILLHNARRTLGAEHTLVHRVLGGTLDKSHLTLAQGHLDTAATGAHVTSGVLGTLAATILESDRQVLGEHVFPLTWQILFLI